MPFYLFIKFVRIMSEFNFREGGHPWSCLALEEELKCCETPLRCRLLHMLRAPFLSHLKLFIPLSEDLLESSSVCACRSEWAREVRWVEERPGWMQYSRRSSPSSRNLHSSGFSPGCRCLWSGGKSQTQTESPWKIESRVLWLPGVEKRMVSPVQCRQHPNLRQILPEQRGQDRK